MGSEENRPNWPQVDEDKAAEAVFIAFQHNQRLSVETLQVLLQGFSEDTQAKIILSLQYSNQLPDELLVPLLTGAYLLSDEEVTAQFGRVFDAIKAALSILRDSRDLPLLIAILQRMYHQEL